MTYRELLEQLSKLTSQQLNQSVTVYLKDSYGSDEYLPVNHMSVSVDYGSYDDVLDADHIVLDTGGE
jgi:hypothetical protein